ncbi:hypothetical protein FKW77_009359 [Venturia effusa]|uniref:RRM domain-containing protein n=1 Tax=Venturia effusa TaxID=50376 RepID=A0A517L817_9PEZI|nr:hypothetical protein FKW77_009359 [Venturia effusa]
MADADNFDEDIFADLYDDDGEPTAAPEAVPAAAPEPVKTEPAIKEEPPQMHQTSSEETMQDAPTNEMNDNTQTQNGYGDMNGGMGHEDNGMQPDETYDHEPIGMKEDGKMFIGGLNWETTDESLKNYFTQFGEVLECTVMRDGATGRSRGFGFLTFKDPKTVNIVMVKEHHLDGKIIDPKRAIPREEQERTAKIFVGGVSQECTEQYFKEFFMKFGRVIDATLMMDKDTGRPRGFGFVTFDGEESVDRTLMQPLNIHGKPIEVKRAEPRNNMQDEKGGAHNKPFNKRDRFGAGQQQNDSYGGGDQNQFQSGGQNAQATAGMSQAQMAQYWFKMQEYFRTMQQNMAQAAQANMGMGMMQGGMNPAMMQQMMMNQPRMMSPGGTPMGPGGAMNPGMMQQMQGQMMQQQQPQPGFNGPPPTAPAGPQAAMMGRSPSAGAARPGFNAQEQMMFEQQKYERQQQARMQQSQYAAQQGMGGPTSWEGMYDDVPAPHVMAPTGPAGRGGFGLRGGAHRGPKHQHTPPAGPVNAPPNAPTGPKNAGPRPGANYRGGGRGGRGAGRGWAPY